MPFEIFLVAIPGLESPLCEEAREKGFAKPKTTIGGVTIEGDWPDVWRANLELRGASKVLARIGHFRAGHLSQLDKSARKFPWDEFLRRDVPVAVEASCKRSKIYHSGAVVQRIATAIAEELGAPIATDAAITVMARLENNVCTLSVDTSGGLLHKRGNKQAIAKAPMRETMAAMFLRQCEYTGNETVIDPMCGSGTFIIEAAEIALGLNPGRNRSFAFENLATFRSHIQSKARTHQPEAHCFGFDRDAGAVKASTANATRAGVSHITHFKTQAISELTPPPNSAPGLIICNPPYGTRIGDKRPLLDLYASFGAVLRKRFAGWRVGLITSNPQLAKATGLALSKGEPVSHGGLRVYLFQTKI
jgi:putative N6-adenine-specific DNA methylase